MRPLPFILTLLFLLFSLPLVSASIEKWRVSTAAYVYSSPALHGKNAIFGSHDNSVYSVNIETGKLEATFPTEGAVDSDPAIYGSTVYIGSSDGYLYALTAPKLELKWRASQKTGGIWRSKPLLASGRVYIGSVDGNVYAFREQDGRLAWNFSTGGEVDTAPAFWNGLLYVASSDGKLYALNATTGAPVSSTLLSGLWLSSPVISENGKLYIGSNTGQVHALDIRNRARPVSEWLPFQTNGAVYATPLLLGDLLVVGSTDHSVYGIKVDSGDQVWKFETNGSIQAQASYTQNLFGGYAVYVGSVDGNVYSLDAENGFPRWSFNTGEWVSASPLAAGSVLVVPSFDGNVRGLSTLSCSFLSPSDGGVLGSQDLDVEGTAWSDSGVSSVDVRADGGSWVRATGTESWAARVHTFTSIGDVVLECRAVSKAGEEKRPYNNITVELQPGVVPFGKVMNAEYTRDEVPYGSQVKITLTGPKGELLSGARATWIGGNAISDRTGVLFVRADAPGEMEVVIKASGYEDKKVKLRVGHNYILYFVVGAVALALGFYILIYRRRPRR